MSKDQPQQCLSMIVCFTIKDGYNDQFIKCLNQLSRETHKEPGTHIHEIFQRCEHANQFLVRASWDSPQDWIEHLKMPHLKKFFDEADFMIQSARSFRLVEEGAYPPIQL